MKTVLNLGGGTNSAAIVTRMVRTGDRPDFIVFADTGGELPRTYAFLDELDAWLAMWEMAPVVRVRGGRIKRYVYRYPLIEWGWGRDECVEEITKAGLSLPGKSSCFFCPNSKPAEVKRLPPEYLARALEIERRALANPKNAMAGLGRSWSWANLMAQGDLFDGPKHGSDAVCDCYDGEDD